MEKQLQLILTTCIVNFVWTFAQSDNQMADQAVLNKVKDDGEIQENFQNLFSSIAKNDAKKSESFHKILRQEDKKERQAFDAMKVALQHTHNRNVYKKMHFYRKMNDETVGAKKRETHDYDRGNRPSLTDTLTPKALERLCDEVLLQIQERDPNATRGEITYVPVHETRLQSDRVIRNTPIFPIDPYQKEKVTTVSCIYMETVFYLTQVNATHVERMNRNEDGTFAFTSQLYPVKIKTV